MPYVDIKVAGQLNDDQKNAIAKDVASSLETHAGKPVSATYITFTEVPRNSWAKHGALLDSNS